MPELPEICTMKTILQQTFKPGSKLSKFELDLSYSPKLMFDKPPLGDRPLRGIQPSTFLGGITSHGKYLILKFISTPHYAGTYETIKSLQVDTTYQIIFPGVGGFILASKEQPKYAAAMWEFEGIEEKIFLVDTRKFARISTVINDGPLGHYPLNQLGPEITTVEPNEFIQRTLKRKGSWREILLNQACISGLGNIYVAEVLFACGVPPMSRDPKVKSEGVANRICWAAKGMIAKAIQMGGSSVSLYVKPDGGKGSFQQNHMVYGRAGKPCLLCGTTIKREKVGIRSSYFCPACQKTE